MKQKPGGIYRLNSKLPKLVFNRVLQKRVAVFQFRYEQSVESNMSLKRLILRESVEWLFEGIVNNRLKAAKYGFNKNEDSSQK